MTLSPTTMTITKQYSIALDSTLSSTPPPSPSPLMTPVRRATRTYGRPRDPKPPHDPDSSLSMSESSSASRQSLYRTAPPDVDEEIPPSSDGLPPDDSDSDSIILAEVLPKQRYHDWRNKLSHIDQRLDDDDDDDATKASASKEPPAGTDTSDVPNRKDPGMSLLHERPRETATTSGRGVELPVNDSLSGFTLSPTSPECQFKGSPAIRRRSTRRPAVVPDSDLEENAIPSSPTSPLYPNPITTPNLHPASTPPTSVEMPKGKGKARDVPPLRFEETQVIPAPAKTKNKSAKNKRKPSEQKTKIKVRSYFVTFECLPANKNHPSSPFIVSSMGHRVPQRRNA